VSAEPEFTLGIEEEYFLVDRATRDVVGDPPPEMLQECEGLLAGQVSPEFLRSQSRSEHGFVRASARPAAICDGCGRPSPARQRGAVWRRSPPGPIHLPAGMRRKPPNAAAMRVCTMICKPSVGGLRSAACTSISAFPMTSCASIFSTKPRTSCRICWRCQPPRPSGKGRTPGLSLTAPRSSTNCHALAPPNALPAGASTGAMSTSWSAPD
jgi:hypothetical protein